MMDDPMEVLSSTFYSNLLIKHIHCFGFVYQQGKWGKTDYHFVVNYFFSTLKLLDT